MPRGAGIRVDRSWKRDPGSAKSPAGNGRKKVPAIFLKGVRRRLLAWQEHKGYRSQSEFAERAGLAESTLKRWLHGKKPKAPDLATLLQLAHNERLSLDWLLFGEGPEMRGSDRPRADLEAAVHTYLTRACATDWLAGYSKEIADRISPPAQLLAELVVQVRERIFRDLETRAKSIDEEKIRTLRSRARELGDGDFRIAALTEWALAKTDVLHGLVQDERFDQVKAGLYAVVDLPQRLDELEEFDRSEYAGLNSISPEPE
jgi:transcriptional regulator with XRE-family HTH domain